MLPSQGWQGDKMAQSKSVWKDLWQMDMTLLYNLRFWPLAILRIFLGFTLGYHGFTRMFGPGNLTGSISYFSSLGIPFPAFSAYLLGVIEIVCGVLLFFGILTRVAAFLAMLEMLKIFFLVHMENGLLVSNNGYEFVLLLIAALLVVLVNGAGHLSLGKNMKGD